MTLLYPRIVGQLVKTFVIQSSIFRIKTCIFGIVLYMFDVCFWKMHFYILQISENLFANRLDAFSYVNLYLKSQFG